MYRKKPVVVEAMQYDGSALGVGSIRTWIVENDGSSEYLCDDVDACLNGEDDGPSSHTFLIRTLEGDMVASLGDWIIKGVQGEFYPCKPDVFALTYEPVD